MKRKKKSRQRSRPKRQRQRKMSEMILEIASDFIHGASSTQEKQNRLEAACSAWNIACSPPAAREKMLDQYVEGYELYNPSINAEGLGEVRAVMEKLVERKLSLFPAVKKQTAGGQVTVEGGKSKIVVLSMEIQE